MVTLNGDKSEKIVQKIMTDLDTHTLEISRPADDFVYGHLVPVLSKKVATASINKLYDSAFTTFHTVIYLANNVLSLFNYKTAFRLDFSVG